MSPIQVTTSAVWSVQAVVAGNVVQQLLVPAGTLTVDPDPGDGLARNEFGSWPTTTSPVHEGPLSVRVSPGLRSGSRAEWVGDRSIVHSSEVATSWEGALPIRSPGTPGALRRPQAGALHAVLGHLLSGVEVPGLVVMPTGTGKTETMLAVTVAAGIERLLVVVLSVDLRDQVAEKFLRLGVLQELGIVSSDALRPAVGSLMHGLPDAQDALELLAHAHVLVTTPDAVHASSPGARETLLAGFTHLMVDEAHHTPARTWRDVVDAFEGRPVLLFTATPHREDGRSLPGRGIYRFPLREAQKDGYFKPIDYKAVVSLADPDRAVAQEAIQRLRDDLRNGHDHVLMARVRSIARTEEVLRHYQDLAADLNPVCVHSQTAPAARRAAREAIRNRDSRVLVCVDMFGEGFDLPELKVAALHDPRKSLSPLIQLVGRFTRSSKEDRLGRASVFVHRDPKAVLTPLRELLREDADWNVVLHDITERLTSAAEAASEFDASFSGGPDDIPLGTLLPKLSAVAHHAPSSEWEPANARTAFGSVNETTTPVAIGAEGTVAWFVVTRTPEVDWADAGGVQNSVSELILMRFDPDRRVLYVYGSEKSSTFDSVALAVLGEGADLIRDEKTFRVLHGLGRLVPTNVGLVDVVSQFRRFSMHVGADVLEALDETQTRDKTQTHIATRGFEDGEPVSISAAQSGRFWTPRTASNVKEWVDWCDRQGRKLLDASIRVEDVLASFVIPKVVTTRPPYPLLAVEWPYVVYEGERSLPHLEWEGRRHSLLEADLTVADYGETGPLRFAVSTPPGNWAMRPTWTQSETGPSRPLPGTHWSSFPAASPSPSETG